MVYEHGSELSVGRRNAVTITIGGGRWVETSRTVIASPHCDTDIDTDNDTDTGGSIMAILWNVSNRVVK